MCVLCKMVFLFIHRYYVDIFNASGCNELVEKFGPWFSLDDNPRAQIFRRNQTTVKDMDSMVRLMRYKLVLMLDVIFVHAYDTNHVLFMRCVSSGTITSRKTHCQSATAVIHLRTERMPSQAGRTWTRLMARIRLAPWGRGRMEEQTWRFWCFSFNFLPSSISSAHTTIHHDPQIFSVFESGLSKRCWLNLMHCVFLCRWPPSECFGTMACWQWAGQHGTSCRPSSGARPHTRTWCTWATLIRGHSSR